jgi:branched-chain amino acid transport system substrate-binding protein
MIVRAETGRGPERTMGDRAMRRTAILAGTLAAVVLAGSGARADDVTLGAEVALTGPMASFIGPNMRAAFEVAVERINAQKLAGDNTVKLLTEDVASDKSQVIAVTTKLASVDKVAAILGPATTVLGAAAAPVAKNLSTPIVAIAYAQDIVKDNPWAYRAYMQAEASSKSIAAFALDHLKVKSAVLVFDRGNDASKEIDDDLRARLTAGGVKILADEGVQQGDTDFGPLATKIVALNPDMLFLATTPEIGANVVIQTRQAGLAPETKLVGIGNLASPAYARTGGKAVWGTYYTSDYFAGLPTEENKEFVAAYRQKMQTDPDVFAAGAYTAAMIVARAIKEAGDHPTREKIRDAIGHTDNFPTVLGTGRMTIDANHMTTYDLAMLQLVNGTNELAK